MAADDMPWPWIGLNRQSASADWQHAAGQARKPFEMLPNTPGKAVVPDASGGLAWRSALNIVGVINDRDASRKASQVSSRAPAPWSAITIIQRLSSIGSNTACNGRAGGSGCVRTSFQSRGALGGIDTTTVAYRISTPTSVSSGRSQPWHRTSSRSARRDRTHPPPDRSPGSPTAPNRDQTECGTRRTTCRRHDLVTRHCGRSLLFPIASARRRSTSSISGLDAQSSDMPKSRFGSMPISGRSYCILVRPPQGQRRRWRDHFRNPGKSPERPEAASQQTMRVSILGSAGPRTGGRCQAVAFQDLHLLEVLCQSASSRQSADSRSDNGRTLTQQTAHAVALLQVRGGQITARWLRWCFRRAATRYIGTTDRREPMAEPRQRGSARSRSPAAPAADFRRLRRRAAARRDGHRQHDCK